MDLNISRLAFFLILKGRVLALFSLIERSLHSVSVPHFCWGDGGHLSILYFQKKGGQKNECLGQGDLSFCHKHWPGGYYDYYYKQTLYNKLWLQWLNSKC